MLTKICSNYPGYSVQDPRGDIYDYNKAKEEENTTSKIMILLIAAISLILFIGIANIFYVAISMRQREINLLTTIGMSDKMINLIVTTESMIYGATGAAHGLVLSIFIIKSVVYIDELPKTGDGSVSYGTERFLDKTGDGS